MSLPKESKLKQLTPKAGKKTADLLICEGLSVHVRQTATGAYSRSYMFRYTINGKVYKESLGSLNEITLSQALIMCNERRRFVLQGQRPSKSIEQTITRETNKPVFADAVKIYLSQRTGLEKSTLENIDQLLRAIAPLNEHTFENPPIAEAREIILKYVSTQRYTKAQRLATLISNLTEIAIDAGLTDVNPFARLKRLVPSHKTQHYRSVNPDNPAEDVRMVLESVLTRGKLADNKKHYLVLGLFLLLRPAEVAGLEIEDVDFSRGTLHCRHTKTLKDGWTIKLDPPLTALLSYLIGKRKRGKILPGVTQHSSASCLNKLFRNRGLPMSCHGWRSAGASWMVHNGVSVEIADACLTHAIKSQVTAAYIRTNFPEERAEAMLKWHNFLVGILKEIPPFSEIF